MVMSKFHWINDDIVIDFPVNHVIQDLMKEAEELDLAGSVEYGSVSDAIDVFCKMSVEAGHMTEEQWNLICRRYPYA